MDWLGSTLLNARVKNALQEMKFTNMPDFLIIPNQVFSDKTLSAVDMMVYGIVYFHTKMKMEKCYASNRSFAEILGVKPNKVSESLSRLQDRDFIKIIYADETKKTRKEIIPLIVMGHHTMPLPLLRPEIQGYSDRSKGVTPIGEQNSNILHKEHNAEQSSAPKVGSFFNENKKDVATPMSLLEFVLMCRGSEHRHVRLIGEYADERKVDFTTRGQWRQFGRRNMRVARSLAPFRDRQLADAIKKIIVDVEKGSGFKWGLETVYKYLIT